MDVDTDSPVARHTCLKLHVGDGGAADAVVFVKGTWFTSHFQLSITDGLDAWVGDATEAEVRQRAEQWDQPVSEYIAMAELYLGFQQPGSVYRFEDAGNGQKRLSWTFEKLGTKLEWRWKCQPSPNNKQATLAILDFLMDANIRLSEEVISVRQSFDKLKLEAEKCLSQSEKFSNEKLEFESSVYGKFIEVLNSKKAKLRDLRSRSQNTDKSPQDEGDSSDKTETFDEGSADELNK
ncbi:hypothetical protein Taro_054712 [Colocasia esculenta]|uniref:DNA repair protein XRCC4 n=1 Tax=Colocasia esculenta TaxID=4460 RepID=A0A843XS22_COLES|nr:hypothetical protein [Colocasia esculenta]